MDDDRPLWDQRIADQLDGAVVLVGMTYNEPDGQRVEQFFGTVIATDEAEGVTLSLDGSRSGETFRDCQEFRARGRYRHQMTNRSPKITANWVFASAHSRGGRFHSWAAVLSTRYSSFIAASSPGK